MDTINTIRVTTEELETNFDHYLDKVYEGTEVIIEYGGNYFSLKTADFYPFEKFWDKYVIQLIGKELKTYSGKSNKIVDVTDKNLVRVTSSDSINEIPKDAFRHAYEILFEHGKVSRKAIHENNPKGRCSSGVFAVLFQFDFIKVSGQNENAWLELKYA